MTVSFLKLKFEKMEFVKQADYIGFVTTKLSNYTKITIHIKIYQKKHANFLSFFHRELFKKKISGTMFLTIFFVKILDQNFSLVMWHKLTKFHDQSFITIK